MEIVDCVNQSNYAQMTLCTFIANGLLFFSFCHPRSGQRSPRPPLKRRVTKFLCKHPLFLLPPSAIGGDLACCCDPGVTSASNGRKNRRYANDEGILFFLRVYCLFLPPRKEAQHARDKRNEVNENAAHFVRSRGWMGVRSDDRLGGRKKNMGDHIVGQTKDWYKR